MCTVPAKLFNIDHLTILKHGRHCTCISYMPHWKVTNCDGWLTVYVTCTYMYTYIRTYMYIYAKNSSLIQSLFNYQKSAMHETIMHTWFIHCRVLSLICRTVELCTYCIYMYTSHLLVHALTVDTRPSFPSRMGPGCKASNDHAMICW